MLAQIEAYSRSHSSLGKLNKKLRLLDSPWPERWCRGRRPARRAAAHGDPGHPAPDRTASRAFSDSSIAPIRTTCSIMRWFSSSACYACAADGAIAIKRHSADLALAADSGREEGSVLADFAAGSGRLRVGSCKLLCGDERSLWLICYFVGQDPSMPLAASLPLSAWPDLSSRLIPIYELLRLPMLANWIASVGQRFFYVLLWNLAIHCQFTLRCICKYTERERWLNYDCNDCWLLVNHGNLVLIKVKFSEIIIKNILH